MATANDIMNKAFRATQAGKLGWELATRDSYRAQIGNMFLTISRDDNEFTFAIYDNDGNLLETSPGTWVETQQRLYEIARRTALKVDDALEHLDQQLKDLI
jgi:hypothetical protein